jgi:hypothetical protein
MFHCCAGISSNKGWIVACEDMTTYRYLNHELLSYGAYGRIDITNLFLIQGILFDVRTKSVEDTQLNCMSRAKSETACVSFLGVNVSQNWVPHLIGLSNEATYFLEMGDVCEQMIFKERNVNRREWNSSVLSNAPIFDFCFYLFKCRVGLDVNLYTFKLIDSSLIALQRQEICRRVFN